MTRTPAPVTLALVGHGQMGRTLERLAPERGFEVVATLGRGAEISRDTLAGAEVAVEFTEPEAAPAVILRLAELGFDVVSGTTGWHDRLPEVREAVERAGTGLLHASNFSLGVALFRRMVRHAVQIMDPNPDWDLHLHEVHHRHKRDHPSGTAVALAGDVLGASTRKTRWAEDPAGGPLEPEVLGISVAREGSVPGTHVLSMDGPDDRIELRHEARSRNGFARGALTAARWIRGRSGVFTLEELLDDLLDDTAHPPTP